MADGISLLQLTRDHFHFRTYSKQRLGKAYHTFNSPAYPVPFPETENLRENAPVCYTAKHAGLWMNDQHHHTFTIQRHPSFLFIAESLLQSDRTLDDEPTLDQT